MRLELKDRIEKHPFRFVVETVIATVVLTTAFVGYVVAKIADLQISRKDLEHQRIINDYEDRLGSIKRTVGKDTLYFDVSKVLISRFDVRNLDERYDEIIPNLLFVNTPASDSWEYDETSEYDLDSYFTPWLYTNVHPTIIKSAQATLLHVWRDEETFHIECEFRFRRLDKCELNFFPAIIVAEISEDQFRRRKDIISDAMKQELESGSHDPIAGQQAIEVLDSFYERQIATMIMIGKINLGMNLSQYVSDFSFNVETMQKTANLLYIQSEYVIYDKDNKNAIYVSMEDFFFGAGGEGLLIRVLEPSIGGRNKTYRWIDRWLSDFRVVREWNLLDRSWVSWSRFKTMQLWRSYDAS